MIKEARGFGADVLEAKENAIANLGANIDEDIQFEVITSEKKKFLGLFGGRQAEVRVFVEVPDPKPKKEKKPAKKQNEKNAKAEVKNEKVVSWVLRQPFLHISGYFLPIILAFCPGLG